MSEEKNGKLKVTIEVEVNEALMEASKSWMPGMHWMGPKWKKDEDWKNKEWKKEELKPGPEKEKSNTKSSKESDLLGLLKTKGKD